MTDISVRLVDPDNESDIERIIDIIHTPLASDMMDEISEMDEDDVEEWIEDSVDSAEDTHATDWEILYAVIPRTDPIDPFREGKLEGFINFYACREVTLRAHREADRLGITVDPALLIVEVSMAKWPQAPSGQMSQGLPKACLDIQKLKAIARAKKMLITAYIDPENVASVKSFEKAGFEKLGLVYYDLDDDIEDLETDGVLMFTLNWEKLLN